MFLVIKSNINKIYHIYKKDLFITAYLEGLSYATFKSEKKAQKWFGKSIEVLHFDDCIEELKKHKRISKDEVILSHEKHSLEIKQKQKEARVKRDAEKDYNMVYATEDKLTEIMPGEFKLNTINMSMQNNARSYLLHYITEGGDENAFGTFRGKVLRIEGEKVLFKEIYVEFFDDSLDIIKGKEDHIWIFDGEEFLNMGVQKDDVVQFNALAYAYKRKDGSIDFALKAPQYIQYIHDYKLPSYVELQAQELQRIMCETYAGDCF